jgi:hypothetical protein
LTLLSVIIENNLTAVLSGISMDLHKRSADTPLSKYLYVLFVRFIHYAITIFICFFVFIFDKKYDIIYILFICTLLLHWIFLDECYLSKVEYDYYKDENEIKRLENQRSGDTHSEPGSQKEQKTNLIHPYLQIFFKENTDYFILFQGIMTAFNILYIYFRNQKIETTYDDMNGMFNSLFLLNIKNILNTDILALLTSFLYFKDSPKRSGGKFNELFSINLRLLFSLFLIVTMAYLMLKERLNLV